MTKAQALAEMERIHSRAVLEERDLSDDEVQRYTELKLSILAKEAPMDPIEVIDTTRPSGELRSFAGEPPKTLYEALRDDGTVARAVQARSARLTVPGMRVRALGSTQAASPAPGIAVTPDYKGILSTYVPVYNRLIDALRSIPTTSNSISYTRIGLATNNAAAVQELAAKPESVLSTSQITQAVNTYAHFVKSSKQVLDDEAGLQALIDITLTEGLKDKIDAAVFAALTTSGAFATYTPTSGDTIGDAIARVASTLRVIEGAGNVHVAVNPATYLAATLAKASGSGAYLGLPPGINASIVQSASVPAGEVFAWTDTGAAFLEREDVSVVVGLDSDDFSHNRVTALCEARGAALTLNANRVLYGALTV